MPSSTRKMRDVQIAKEIIVLLFMNILSIFGVFVMGKEIDPMKIEKKENDERGIFNHIESRNFLTFSV